MKKTITLILIALVTMALLVGCGGGGGMPDGENVITIGVQKHPQVTDYENNYFTKWLEEKTGYDIRVIEFLGTDMDVKTQIATMIASGEKLPDILCISFGDSLRNDYAEQGYFIDLKPYFDDKEKSKNFWDALEQMDKNTQDWFYHKVENQVTGGWYQIPYFEPNEIDQMPFQPWINQNWLDTLGLPVPTNTDDLVSVLRAFLTQDPNRNGLPDEIPCMGSTTDMGGNILGWLINMKMYHDTGNLVSVDADGKVIADCTTQEYRDALIWIHDLMAEGLVSPLSVTTKGAQLKANLAAGDFIGLCIGHATATLPDPESLQKWTPLPIWGSVFWRDVSMAFKNQITEDCDNPDGAWEVLMAMYDREGTLIQRWGEKGVNWDYADEGALSAFGTPADIKIYVDPYTQTMTSSCWRTPICGYLKTTEVVDIQVGDDMTQLERDYYTKQATMSQNFKDAYAKNTPVNAVPRLMWTDDLKKEAPYRTDVTNLMSTYTSKFVTGQLNPRSEEDWNQYLKELKDATYDTWIATVQKVVDHMIETGVFDFKK